MTATAAQTTSALFAGNAYDPTAAGGLVAWQRPKGVALLLRAGASVGLPGSHAALSAGQIAWLEGDEVVIADPATLQPRERHAAPGAGVIALSDAALAWRTRDEAGTDRLWARLLADPSEPRLLLESPAPQEIGRPALAGQLLLCHIAGPLGSRLLGIDVATGVPVDLRSEPGAQLSNPATDGTRMLYVHATGRQQELRLGPPAPLVPAADAVLVVHPSPGQRDRERERGRHRHRKGYRGRRPPLPPRAPDGVIATLWSTALTGETAFVTRLRAIRGQARSADILSVPAPP